MELSPVPSPVRWTAAPRMIPSRYPVVGLLDRVASPADLEAVFELEGWTNDRISNELGLLHTIPEAEWVTGEPMASVVMAAYCHPRPGGGRFSSDERGAWYAGRGIATALAESVYHRTAELREVGGFETAVQMRVYLADFRSRFHDLRPVNAEWARLLRSGRLRRVPGPRTPAPRCRLQRHRLSLGQGSGRRVHRVLPPAAGRPCAGRRPL